MVRERLQARLDRFPAYSYRADPLLANMPDDKPLIVFDGVCVLCSGFVRFVIAREKRAHFRLTTAQSATGQALFRHYGLDTSDFDTNLLVEAGRAYAKLATVERILPELGGMWPAVAMLTRLPGPLADWVYDRIARNRYALFGRTTTCLVPPPGWRDRIIE